MKHITFRNNYLLLTILVFLIYLASFKFRFLDPFVVGTWWAPSPGGDFYSIPRSFINLQYQKSIFDTRFFPYGDHSAPYFFHPVLSILLGSWLMIFSPVTAFYIFVAISILIIFYCGTLLNEIFNKEGKEYLLLSCSVGTYLMLWNAQVHIFVLLSVSLVLNGLHQLKIGNSRLANWRILFGILASLFSKPVILLSIPYLLILPNIRKTLIKSLIIYILVSVIFLIDSPLNPEGDNWIHWKNILYQSKTGDSNPGIFSISWFILALKNSEKLPPGVHYLLKIPLLIAMTPLLKLLLKRNFDLIKFSTLGFLLTTISFYMSYTVVWEYHYASLLPVLMYILWNNDFKFKKINIFSFFIISTPVLYQSNENVSFSTPLIIGKFIKLSCICIIYFIVLKKILAEITNKTGDLH